VSATAIALLLKIWLKPLFPETLGSFFYIAILVSTWYSGSRAGIVTTILSALAIDYFFLSPQYQPWIYRSEDLLQLSIFLLVALLINLLTSNFLKSKQKIQQLSQKLAQENAEQLRMALSAAQMGMWDWNMGNFIRINHTELKWLGYSHDEILQKHFLDIVTSESQKIFQENFSKLKQQGWVNNLEFEIVN